MLNAIWRSTSIRRRHANKSNTFVDVCALLRLAIERLGQSIPFQAAAGIRATGEHVLLALEPAKGLLNVHDFVGTKTEMTEVFGTKTEFVLPRFGKESHYLPAEYSAKPSRSLVLSMASRKEWTPLLREFVDVQPSRAGRVTKVHDGVATIWSSRSYALEDLAETKLGELLDLVPGRRGDAEPGAPAQTDSP